MENPIQWARYRWQRLLSTNGSSNQGILSTIQGWFKTSQSQKNGHRHRIVVPSFSELEEYENFTKHYMNNRIQTTKYTLLNFIPRNLFEQFHRVANIYFLFIVVLNWVPLVEAFKKEITMMPLMIVLLIIAIKDAIEDYRRYKFDEQLNNRVTDVYDKKEKEYVPHWWKELHVGDLIRLNCNELIPADMVLLYSSDDDGICHIETSNLDGETNLKQCHVVRGLEEQDFESNPETFRSRIECETPNNNLNKFTGFMENENKIRFGLSKKHLLLRNCTIRNTEAVVGIAVYAGHETKALLNNSGPRYKRSKLERRLNIDVLWCVVLLIIMCLTGAIGHGVWLKAYLQIATFNVQGGISASPSYNAFFTFWTNIILLQVLIPISLYVTIEIVKLGQIYFLQNDIDLYNESTNSSIQCQALNITENLGQVDYIFSDKTGTLTENKMIFSRCNVAGIEYPHEENAKRLEFYKVSDSENDLWNINGESPTKAKSRIENCKPKSWLRRHMFNCFYHDVELKGEASHRNSLLSRKVAFSSSIEKDVAPDSELLRKLKLFTSQPLDLFNEVDGDLALEFTQIIDFFLALAICNTVVVSNPNSIGQRIRTPSISKIPLKSLDELKQLFQRFSVSRTSPSSLSSLKDPFAESPSLLVTKLLGRLKLASISSSTDQRQISALRPIKTTGLHSPPDRRTEILMENDLVTEASSSTSTSIGEEGVSYLNLSYEAESPDEAALVHAAKAYACTLVSRTPSQVTVELRDRGLLHFQLLHILPFDSIRKRMSVVVRHPLTNKVVVYTKGADSVMMELLNIEHMDRKRHRLKYIKEKTQKYLDFYATEGLRTLCIAKKVMSTVDYSEWLRFHTKAETSIENREELLLQSALKLETSLTLIGATGIMDRLQEGVPETIRALRTAGIKIWVLTGDKRETAINIAFACKLLDQKDTILNLHSDTKEDCEDLLNTNISKLKNQAASQKITHHSFNVNFLPFSSGCELKSQGYLGLVIDGKTLEFALHESLQDRFIELAEQCRAVICCRSAPLQKSRVVQLVRNKLKVLALAVGDGANDVSMIQVADIGIGISGQEGMQAAVSSDFAISRFKHLKKLLLVHGHWCYSRLANMILYFFYKNVTYVGLLFWYQFFCGFSGSSMIDYWILVLFNLLFTSIPPIVYGILDKDVSAETLLQFPQLYKSGHKIFSSLTFWISILDAFYQSLMCFFVSYFTYFDSEYDIYSFGTPINTAALFIIIMHLMIEGKTWTRIHWTIMILSVSLYFIVGLAFGVDCINCNPPSNPLWIFQNQMIKPLFYLVCVLSVVVALLPRYLFRIIQGTIFPSPLIWARYIDSLSPKERQQITQQGTYNNEASEQNYSGTINITSLNANNLTLIQSVSELPSSLPQESDKVPPMNISAKPKTRRLSSPVPSTHKVAPQIAQVTIEKNTGKLKQGAVKTQKPQQETHKTATASVASKTTEKLKKDKMRES